MTEQQMPGFGDVIKMPPGGFDALPNSPMPYYVTAKEGLFVHRKLLIGHGAVKVSTMPSNFKEMGSYTGQFLFDAPPIPGDLMSQIVHFFRRIYEKQKTEAAVLLTLHEETKEWGVFIPTQLVSHGGVNYVYDPGHISGGRLVVGSIHSHCDFSAFHSGTDTGDAAEFDGFHATVGFIMRQTPQIVAMIAMNKQNLHYQESAFPYLFDYSALWTKEAPEWWDQYVGPNSGSAKPVGFELYKKFEKPTEVRSHTTSSSTSVQRWVPPTQQSNTRGDHNLRAIPGGRGWDPDAYMAQQMMADWGVPGFGAGPSEDRQRVVSPWWAGYSVEKLKDMGYEWSEGLKTYRWVGNATYSQNLRESEEFNARKQAEKGVEWTGDGGLRIKKLSKKESEDLLRDMSEGDYWEDLLIASANEEVRDAILECDSLTEDDFLDATMKPREAGDAGYWKDLIFRKTITAVETLRTLGLDISISLKTGQPGDQDQIEWLLPEGPQTKTTEASDAVQ